MGPCIRCKRPNAYAFSEIADGRNQVPCCVTCYDELVHEATLGKKALKILHDLTPGGSEFVNDPEYCAAWIKRVRYDQLNMIRRFKIQAGAAQKTCSDIAKLVGADPAERDGERLYHTVKAKTNLLERLVETILTVEKAKTDMPAYRLFYAHRFVQPDEKQWEVIVALACEFTVKTERAK